MMNKFKFFSDNCDEEQSIERYRGASWIFGRLEHVNQYRYEIIEENHYGIHSFLNQFPEGFIACVISIVGPNGRLHDVDSEYEDGWGFDITSDYINIRWIRFRE
jgi:hypothetical protein